MKTAADDDHRGNMDTASIEGEREHNVDDVDNDADNDTEEEEDMPDVQLAHDPIWDELPVRQRSRLQKGIADNRPGPRRTYRRTLYPLLVRLDHLRFDKARYERGAVRPSWHSKSVHILFHFSSVLWGIFYIMANSCLLKRY